MTRCLRWAALPFLILAMAILPAAGQEKKEEKKPGDKTDMTEPKKEEKKAESPYKVVVPALPAKILHVDEAKKEIKVRVTVMVPNQGEIQALQQTQQRLLQLQQDVGRQRRDPAGWQRDVIAAQQDLAKHQANLLKKEEKDYDLTCTEDVKVRSEKLPTQFNEKGEIKKEKDYTKKELEDLKGPDKSLPGYNAEFSDVRNDMMVVLQLVVKKDMPKPMPGEKPDPKLPGTPGVGGVGGIGLGGPAITPEAMAATKPMIGMIIIP